jgi:hypothetical protein
MYYYFIRFNPHKRKTHNFFLENLKKEFGIHRRMREENFKNDVGESACKNVDSIICLTMGQGVDSIKSGEKVSGYIKFRRFLE